MSVFLHTFSSLTFMPLISSALHIKLSHTSMLSLAYQAQVESLQLEEFDFCHKVKFHLKFSNSSIRSTSMLIVN